MWQHNYTPLGDSLALSALLAAAPIFLLLILLGILRKPSWMAGLAGLACAILVAGPGYGMPLPLIAGAVSHGAAFGLFPIGWIVFWAIVLYRVTVDTGKFEIIKDSVGSLTGDRRLQALLIAFAFGAFVEGAAGFGTPVAVAAAMLTGLGFSPFYSAGICLLANTAPVAFGSIGIPLITLADVTKLPLHSLSGAVGRICAPVSLIVPAYLIAVMGGWRALRGILPGAIACGVAFAGTQYAVSNFVGPQLTDILSSLAAIVALVALLSFWKPADDFRLEGEAPAPRVAHRRHSGGEIALAWAPYFLLVIFVLLWGSPFLKPSLDRATLLFPWPGLHNLIERIPPVVARPSAYTAVYKFEWLAASGTACMMAACCSALLLRVGFGRFFGILGETLHKLALSMVTIASVLGLAYLMNYSGATATLGLAFAATGRTFPFFSALLGWVGVFLTGSDTSANALFGNLQVVTANRLGLDPVLMASANSSGGVMGKMISLQSIAVAAAATGMERSQESRLFRFTAVHSVVLASLIGLISMFYAHL